MRAPDLAKHWRNALRQAGVFEHLLAAAAALLLWLPLAVVLTVSHRQLGESLAAEAISRADLHGRLMAATVDRVVASVQLLPLALGGRDAEEVRRLLGRLSRLGNPGSRYELILPGGEKTLLHSGNPEPSSGRNPLPLPGAELSPLGDLAWSLRSGDIMVSQALFLPAPEGNPRFWGYASATLPFADLVRAIQLEPLAAEGLGVSLRHHSTGQEAPVTLYSAPNGESTASAVRSVSLPRSGTLQLEIQPRRGPPPFVAALGWLAAGLILFPLHGALLIIICRRREQESGGPDPVERQQSLEREIAQRILAERLLERSHQMLDAIFEHLPGMVMVKRADDLRVSRVNRGGEALLQRQRDLIIGRANEELYEPALAARLTASDHQVMNERTVVELPLTKLSLPGQPDRWVRIRKIALCDRSGLPEYVLEFGEDETERQNLDLRLREHLNFLEQLLEAIPAPLFFKDSRGRYISVNSAFERLMGRSRAELAGKTVFDIAPPSLAFTYHRADIELLQAGGTQMYETAVETADSGTRAVMFHKAVFRSTTGSAGGIVGVVLDISERKEAEGRIRRLNRILTVLSETSQAIVRITDREALLTTVGDLIREKGEFPAAWVYLCGGGRECRVVTGQPELSDLAREVTRNHGICRCGETAAEARDAGTWYAASLPRRVPGGLDSYIDLPLRLRGNPVGGIGILGQGLDELPSEERRMLVGLADNVAFALEALEEAEARRAVETRLHLSARVFDTSAEGIVVTDASNHILLVNKAFSAMTGYAPEEVIGRNPRLLNSGRQSQEFYSRMWETLLEHGEWRGEIENRRSSGEIFPEWLTISVVRDAAGAVTNFIAVFSDLTRHKEIEARLDFLAYYDSLTGLPNRSLFADRVQQALARTASGPTHKAVLLLDIDRFKVINDSVGQSAGDRVLLAIAERLQACVPEGSCMARLGGDNFAILLEGVDGPDGAAALARSVQRRLRKPLAAGDTEIHLAVSIGISVSPEDGTSAESLIAAADTALYAASGSGGNGYRFFGQDMNRHASERMRMESRLHTALQRHEFRLHYQPLVDAESGRIIGAEALLRWFNDDFGGEVSPAVFVPVLEETGLIVPVGEWVLHTACEENARWRTSLACDLSVAVNLSVIQLTDEHLPHKIASLLARLDFPPDRLEIELTESAVMRDATAGLAALRSLKSLGVRLSVDDFGTGYSSLAYLKQFPLDILKIDRSFVTDAPYLPEAASIVRAIAALGHALQLEIIAEGVEDSEQLEFLRDARIEVLQGYYFSRPLPAEQFRRLVTDLGSFPLPSTPRPPAVITPLHPLKARGPG
ncbi:MAG: EAL domain-containing protein [Dechloromonas sp.]|nr:EAL domain-containing protein [Dechloromonas sp.]